MSKVNVFDELYAKDKSPLEFNFDSMWLPSMYNYLSQHDIDSLYNVASSIKYAGNINLKYKQIDQIMRARGFRKFATGTNRTVYKCMEDTRFLAKIAIDRVGLSDSPKEFQNQILLKPFVTKVFEVDNSGVISTVERVDPITSREEFSYIAEDVFDLLVKCIIGKYVLEDVGSQYFMNWGVRKGFGPCLLDFPYLYELDGNKLYCNIPVVAGTKFPLCGGEIDYDIGFNKLVCNICGKQYQAKELQVAKQNKLILIKGDETMSVRLMRGNEVVYDPFKESPVIKAPKKEYKPNKKPVNLSVPKLVRGIHKDDDALTEYSKTDPNKTSRIVLSTGPVMSTGAVEPFKSDDFNQCGNFVGIDVNNSMAREDSEEGGCKDYTVQAPSSSNEVTDIDKIVDQVKESINDDSIAETVEEGSAIMSQGIKYAMQNSDSAEGKTEDELLKEMGLSPEDIKDPRKEAIAVNKDRNSAENKEKFINKY